MSVLRDVSVWVLAAAWLAFSGLLAWNHWRVRRERSRQGIAEERPAIRDPRSMRGLMLEGLSFLIALVFFRSPAEAADWRQVASIVAGVTAVGLLGWALRHLDLEWRIKAVVTEDHRLVTSGPYAVVRHPIFTALFCLLLAHVLLLTSSIAAVAALVICAYGTQIRVNAEDGLLARRFGVTHDEYRRRVPAWNPLVRL